MNTSESHRTGWVGRQDPRRPLNAGERLLIAGLLAYLKEDRQRYLAQLHLANVVGGCDCGCPSIDISIGGAGPQTLEGSEILVGGDATSPEGTPVGVLLWVRDCEIVSLEVHPWDDTESFALPRPETLKNVGPGVSDRDEA
jgi:hypothetical protein